MLVGYDKDNHYARFHNCSYHRYRETHLYIYFTGHELLTDGQKV